MIMFRETTKHNSHDTKIHLKRRASSCESTESSSCCGSVDSLSETKVSTKRVRFAPISGHQRQSSREYKSTVSQKTTWYSRQEARRMRLDAKRCARIACTVDTTYAESVGHVCWDVSFRSASMAYDALNKLLTDKEFLVNMAAILNGDPCREEDASFRGIEDLISDDRRFIRGVSEEARELVILTSRYSKTCLAKETALCYKAMSMSAVLYARILAVADEIAVKRHT